MSRDASFRSPLASFAAAVAIAAVVIGGTYGCHQQSSPTEPLPGQTTTLAVRQTTTIAAGVALSFDRVLSDSRCPSGVVCVGRRGDRCAYSVRLERHSGFHPLRSLAHTSRRWVLLSARLNSTDSERRYGDSGRRLSGHHSRLAVGLLHPGWRFK